MARLVVLSAISETWQKFWQDYHKLPPVVWSRWRRTLAIGWVILAIGSLGVTLYAKSMSLQGLQTWDEKLLPILADTLPLSFARGITWESPGNLLVALPVVLTALSILVWRSKPLLAASLAASYLLQFPLVWIGWGLWNRPRPKLIANGVAAPSLHSFPSGHAAVACTVYGFLLYLWFRNASSKLERLLAIGCFLLWVGLIGSARLELGAHWPSDVIAGLILGILWLLTVILALRRAEAANAKQKKLGTIAPPNL